MSIFSICGFNGFGQLSSVLFICDEGSIQTYTSKNNYKNILNEFQLLHSKGSLIISRCALFMSWSYISICQDNNLYICGFVNDKENQIEALKIPNNTKINNISGNRRQIICVTKEGGCWQYNLMTKEWKDIVVMCCAENCEEDAETPIMTKVSCGETVTALLTDKGDVYNSLHKLTFTSGKAVDVACGRSHILILSERGEVYSLGEGSRGQLGHGELEDEEEPRLVDALAGLKVTALACGGWHSCAITEDGDLYSWGWNMAGQLGLTDGGEQSKVSVQATPVAVDWPTRDAGDVRVIKVSCGARHTLTLLDDGSVWGCGWNGYGQLALPGVESVNHMTRLPSPHPQAQDIVCGSWNSAILT